jgi:DNA-directed RNA polymerase
MRQRLLNSLYKRILEEIPAQSSLMYLKDLNTNDYIDTLISTVYLYTRPKKDRAKSSTYFSETIAAIGHGVRNKLKLKRDSSNAAKLGAFLLYSFEELHMIQVVLSKGSKHAAFIVTVTNDDAIAGLWNSVSISRTEKLPALTPHENWTSPRHKTGLSIIKTNNRAVLDSVSPETHRIMFNNLNRAQAKSWSINIQVYEIHKWAIKNKTDAFADIWELQNPEAKATKLREAKAIGDLAKRFLHKTFYHLYYYDFRGRMYPYTTYLHEQGSDFARGLLKRGEGEILGLEGFFWMMVHAANTWAGDSGRTDGVKTDKLPIKDRYTWSMDNEEILLSYAESPKVNQGWMKADKPWQFLAVCVEIKLLREWQFENGGDFDNYDYVCRLEGFIDGSNNGCQHLAALTRDEITAPHVNLVPLNLPGDLYRYVGEHVWKTLEEAIDEIPLDVRVDCEKFINKLVDFKRQIHGAERTSELRKELVEQIQDFKSRNKELAELVAPLFWRRVTDAKHRRKIVKRNVMTIPYGGTAYGLGQQQIDDARKHNIDVLTHMEHKWGAYLGRAVFEDCKTSLRRPMQLLSVFEAAGKAAEERGEFLSWHTPITNFPVVQNYTEGVTKKVWVQYGPPKGERLSTGRFENTYQIFICFIEETVPSKGKQSQGASPNAIHSLDATHLAMTIDACNFDVTTIHDSFGCLFNNMPTLFKVVREQFVRLYSQDPLTHLMKEINGDLTNVEIGTLDINKVLESEYAFA